MLTSVVFAGTSCTNPDQDSYQNGSRLATHVTGSPRLTKPGSGHGAPLAVPRTDGISGGKFKQAFEKISSTPAKLRRDRRDRLDRRVSTSGDYLAFHQQPIISSTRTTSSYLDKDVGLELFGQHSPLPNPHLCVRLLLFDR